jgi:hypothetical protein
MISSISSYAASCFVCAGRHGAHAAYCFRQALEQRLIVQLPVMGTRAKSATNKRSSISGLRATGLLVAQRATVHCYQYG